MTDQQVKLLFKLVNEKTMTKKTAAAKAGMSEPTAHKYLRIGKLPSELRPERGYRTHMDAFAGVWPEAEGFLRDNPKLEAKALFEYIRRTYPGQFSPGQLRTFQRRVQQWRLAHGPAKPVYFAQVYVPGERAQSDFTCMNSLQVTIQGEPFPHLLYHFVLAYSNWESGMICKSESFAALSAGLQKALWELGGVPKLHQTDSLSCAVRNHPGRQEEFTQDYQALCRHYRIQMRHTQPGSPQENGKIEQRHHRFKRALENELILRGSRDFATHQEYAALLQKLFTALNALRQEGLEKERPHLGGLPIQRLGSFRRMQVRVSKWSIIQVDRNRYSVPSRLIGSRVQVRMYAEWIEVWSAQTCLERMPRLHGRDQQRVDYRHLIDTLVRKPGAFANYRYRTELYPTQTFRRAFDALQDACTHSLQADKAYLKLLHLAATQGQAQVEAALEILLTRNAAITVHSTQQMLEDPRQNPSVIDVQLYDALLQPQHAAQERR